MKSAKHLSAPIAVRLRRKEARRRQSERDRHNGLIWDPVLLNRYPELEGAGFGTPYSRLVPWGARGSGSRFGRMKRKGERAKSALAKLANKPRRLIITPRQEAAQSRRDLSAKLWIRGALRGIRGLGRKVLGG